MDRRTVSALFASLPVLASSPAEACIVLPIDAESVERQNARVRQLFEAWWGRDISRFRSLFTNPIKDDGSPLEPAIVQAWQGRGVYLLPEPTRLLFDRVFGDPRTTKRISRIVNTHLGVIVTCTEWTGVASIGACRDAGQSHLFFVEIGGLNPRSVTHLASGSGEEEDRFIVWAHDAG